MTKAELKKLISKMTIKDKAFELLQLSPAFYGEDGEAETGPAVSLGIEPDDAFNTNSVLNYFGADRVIKIKKEHYEKNKYHIPMMLMADIIHGCATILPIPLAMGCSFDPELVKKVYHNTAVECAYGGIDVTFTPMVDLVRDARWGRVYESTGEDKYLNGVLARAMVEGLQGDSFENEGTIAACIKHFAGYGAVESGREYNVVDMSDRNLREYYLPGYKEGIDAGAEMVMTAFNSIGGVPSTGNKWLLRDILRKEWGFDGVTISDWGSASSLQLHGVAADLREAAKLCIEAGLDIEMCTPAYIRSLEDLVASGEIKEKLIDEAVLRVLTLKNKLGLFENPIRFADAEKEKKYFRCDEFMEDARKMVCASSVLLKNDENILPLKEGKVALIGPYVDCERFNGTWAKVGMNCRNVTVREAFEGKGDYLFAKGSHRMGVEESMEAITLNYEIDDSDREKLLKEAVKTAKKAKTVVLFIGEHFDQSGEAHAHTELKIPETQMELLRKVYEVNKNIVVVLFNGRPLDLREICEKSKAVMTVWMPGSSAAAAIYDMLTGAEEPTGRLSMTMPYNVGQCPIYYNRVRTCHRFNPDPKARFSNKYSDTQSTPLFTFGEGIGYTSFEYSGVTIEPKLTRGGKITASVTLKNTGARRGTETVQMYIYDKVASVARPFKELKGFSKVTLDAGEEREISFEINEDMLKYWNIDMKFEADKGGFTVYIGHDSNTTNSADFELI